MALQVWLPLNGNLDNNGLNNVTVTNSEATVDNNGKIGKCYSFNGTSSETTINGIDLSGCATFSICVWLCPTNTNNVTAAVAFSRNTYWQFVFYNKQIDIRDTSTGITGTRKSYTMGDFSAGVWTHVAITYNRGEVKIYRDGVLYSTNNTGGTSFNVDTFAYKLGRANGESYRYNGKINDFRIYDHCLSQKEVKDISKGLILHYKLDDEYVESTVNLGGTSSNYSNQLEGNTYTANSWGGDAGTVTFYKSGGYNDGPYKVYHKTSTGSGGIFRKTADDILIEAGKTYTMSIYVKASRNFTDSRYSFNINRSAATEYSASNRYITASTDIHFTTEWQRIIRTFTATNDDAGTYGDNSIIYNDEVEDYYVYYSCFQIEEKDHATPYVNGSRTNSIISDNSGYSYNGSIIGNLSSSLDSLRYERSTYFDGNSSIDIEKQLYDIVDEISVCFWCKGSNIPRALSCTEGGGWNFEYNNNKYNFALYTTQLAYSPIILSNVVNDNNWHFVVGTFDGTTKKIYTDGVLSDQTTLDQKYLIKYNKNTNLYIGQESPSGYKAVGYMSDVRIYSTALSADDILELYNTSAFIDNQGNLDCFEIKEVDETQSNILKNGEVDSYNFMEVHPYLYLPAGSSVDSGLYYNAGDTCKAETIIRYSGGSGRDLMGYSASGGGYWGVTANGTWEPHGTFTYTNSDISVVNHISYTFYSATEKGTYVIGKLANTYSVRNKYIYRVRLYRNGILERDLHPLIENSVCGLFDMLNGVFYPSSGSGVTVGYEEEDNIAKIYKNHIKANQIIEI